MNFISRDTGESGAESVQTVRLDRFCQDHSIEYVDLLKLYIQGQEHSASQAAEYLIRDGRVTFFFCGTQLGQKCWIPCAAIESIRLLDQAGYRFSRPGKRLNWEKAGDWLRTLSDVVAYRARP